MRFTPTSLPTLLAVLTLAVSLSVRAAEPAPKAAAGSVAMTPTDTIGADEIRIWPEGTPGKLGDRPQDVPTLTPYLPEPGKRNGASVVIFPGGGYSGLAVHEGKGYAEWFVNHGFAAYVLKYRLGSAGYRHPAMINDAARALRLVRSYARRDGLDPARVIVIGSSAGGHLASTLITHFDAGRSDAKDPAERESSRPDLGILCYPVISLGEFAHAGSKKNLLGDTPAADLVQSLSNELQVTKETPPTFIWHTFEDATVPVENSLMFAAALRRAGVPFSLHIYETGRHGLGLGGTRGAAPPWADELLFWFGERKFLKK
jgi:acetyl esterase/lipase